VPRRNDFLAGYYDNDSLKGDGGNDYLSGYIGADSLDGGSGNDTSIGGAGWDSMTGGSGADVFRYTAIADAAAHFEEITDFTQGTDKIDFSLIDANEGTAANDAFTYIGFSSFYAPGQIERYDIGGFTFLYLNTDSDSNAEGVVAFGSTINFNNADFFL